MNFEQLLYVEVLAQHQSMQKAADILHISKSGLSTSVRQLEEELGITLFERTKKGSKLTSQGEKVISSISEILRSKMQLEQVAEMVATPNIPQTISIQYMNTMLRPFISTFLDLNKTHEQQLFISCQDFETIVQNVQEQKIDAGFIAINNFEHPLLSNLSFTVVGKSKMVLSCLPENLLSNLDRPVSLDDLKSQKYCLFNDSSHDVFFDRLQFLCGPLRLVMRVDDAWAMEEVVKSENAVFFW
ncbi:LysR family transcriptional regulator [Streptococcus halotolerans]|uniref:LysR family transcriptional regulator n=1 Tax=Streptococcus halotolerans TaxID=1814128 RepID=UPI000AE8689C|nr:LysR family transcriptional regulator [Streptococcus halotolerans]